MASTMIELHNIQPTVEGLGPVFAADNRREKVGERVKVIMASGGSTGVEHLPRHSKVKGSSTAMTRNREYGRK